MTMYFSYSNNLWRNLDAIVPTVTFMAYVYIEWIEADIYTYPFFFTHPHPQCSERRPNHSMFGVPLRLCHSSKINLP